MLWCCEEHKKKWLLIASSSAKCFGFDSIRPVDLDHMCWDLSSEMTQIWSLDQIWSQSHQTTFQAEPRAQWWLSKHPSRAYLWICVGAYWNPNKVCFYILWYYELFLFSLDRVLCLSKFYYLSSPVPAWPFRLTLDLTGNFDLFFFSRKIANLIKTVAQKSFCKFDLSEFKERLKLQRRMTSVTKMFLLGNGQIWTNTSQKSPIKHKWLGFDPESIPLANQVNIPQRTGVTCDSECEVTPCGLPGLRSLCICVSPVNIREQLIRSSLSGLTWEI